MSKSGSLACLANAGYNLRVADFDGHFADMAPFFTPEARARVEIVSLEDKLRDDARHIGPSGTPTAFGRFLKLWNNWEYETPEGKVSLGPVRSWTRRDILVVDSMTAMGRANMRRTLALNNRTIDNRREADWGAAQHDEQEVMQILTGDDIPCHVVVTAHLKLIAPKDVEKTDDDLTKNIKEQVAEIVKARLFPSALGRANPPDIAQHFSTVLHFDAEFVNGKEKRIIRTVPSPEVPCVKVPVGGLPRTLPIDTGMLTIFDALVGPLPKEVAPAVAA